jgi:hypothetical protein
VPKRPSLRIKQIIASQKEQAGLPVAHLFKKCQSLLPKQFEPNLSMKVFCLF